MQSFVGKQQWIAPLDAKCKIKAGRVSEHKIGKLIAPNNILIFTDLWHYVRSILNQHLVSSSSHLQANGNEASGFGFMSKCSSESFCLYKSVHLSNMDKTSCATHCFYARVCETSKYNSYPKSRSLEGACVYFNLNNRAAASIYGAVRKYYSPVAALGWGQSNGCLFSGRSCQHRRLRSPSCCQVTFNPEQIFCMCCSAVTCNPWVLGTDCQDKEIGFISVTATKQYPPLKGYFCS